MSDPIRQQLAELLQAHLVPLRRAAFRLCRDAGDAEDLVQEVCLRAYEKRSELAGAGSPRGWLLRVQYNLHIDETRRRSRTDSVPFDDSAESSADRRWGDDVLQSRAETALLVEALGRVWPALNADQQALLAYYAEGYSLAEIGEITGLPISALKARLHRARIRLGKLLATDARPSTLSAISGDQR
jgi:RNA polymerase sigma-70 factor (ECF subfamily)